MRRLAFVLLALLSGCGGCGGCGPKDTTVPVDMPENAAQKRERRQREAWAKQPEKSPEPEEARPAYGLSVDSGVQPPPPRGDPRVAGGFYNGLATNSTVSPYFRQAPDEKAYAPSGPSGPQGR